MFDSIILAKKSKVKKVDVNDQDKGAKVMVFVLDTQSKKYKEEVCVIRFVEEADLDKFVEVAQTIISGE